MRLHIFYFQYSREQLQMFSPDRCPLLFQANVYESLQSGPHRARPFIVSQYMKRRILDGKPATEKKKLVGLARGSSGRRATHGLAHREPESQSRAAAGSATAGPGRDASPRLRRVRKAHTWQPACDGLFGVCSPACHVTAAEKAGPSLGPSTGFRVRSGPGPCAAARISSLAPPFRPPSSGSSRPDKPPGPRLGWSPKRRLPTKASKVRRC